VARKLIFQDDKIIEEFWATRMKPRQGDWTPWEDMGLDRISLNALREYIAEKSVIPKWNRSAVPIYGSPDGPGIYEMKQQDYYLVQFKVFQLIEHIPDCEDPVTEGTSIEADLV